MNHIVIGLCPQCGHAMKVKEHAPRPHMSYTCHCGWHGHVEVDAAILAQAEALRDEGVGHRHKAPPTFWQKIVRRLTSWWPAK